jgi:hypothetical protein
MAKLGVHWHIADRILNHEQGVIAVWPRSTIAMPTSMSGARLIPRP